jgi:chromosome segregation ATPase
MAQATHEKLLEDMQSRCKRQVDAAQRNVKMELEESQEMIQELSEQVQVLQEEASREKANADKYKHETEKVNDRLQVTNSQLVEVSSQCQKLTESAMMKDRDNRGHMDMQRLENVQSEEALQNYQKQIYELQLELEQSKNDTSLQLEINRLRSQVASQNEDNDDLKAQLLKQNIVRAKELAEQSSNSLAAEIETAERRPNGANSTEIIDKLTRDLTSCKSNNEQLRQYLDKILQSILEKDPSILEVK